VKLKIAADLALPLETVTQTIAILAKRRAGKSYAMRRLVEQLFKAGQQVVLADPKGDQWGMRSAADGKGPGLPIVILGGERGDVPLEPGGGEVVAKLVVEEEVSVLLDLSLFRKHEVATFMTAFLENLYRLKAREIYRTPMMLVIDEADSIAPQKPQKGEERMLGAAEDIVRRGGQRGIGCVLVTQRSAVLNKNVLTQAQMLVALRTIAPQDLAAMDAWIQVHGEPEQRKTLMDSLPALPVGDAWFWSPGWPTVEGIFKRVHVLPIETFDSGATPKPGEKPVEPKHAADVDLEALKRQMAATIERAKADDPRELRRQLAEKDKRLKKLEAGISQDMPRYTPKSMLTDADRALLDRLHGRLSELAAKLSENRAERADRLIGQIGAAVESAMQTFTDQDQAWTEELTRILEAVSFQKILAKLQALSQQPGLPKGHGPGHAVPPIRAASETRHEVKPHGAPSAHDGHLDGTQQRTLDAIAMLNVRGIDVRREAVARWMGIHPNGGRYLTGLARLRDMGYLDGWSLTEKGRAAAREWPTGSDAVLDAIKDGTQKRTLEVLLQAQQALSRQQIAERLGIHPNGGRFLTGLARLREMGVITDRSPIVVTEGTRR